MIDWSRYRRNWFDDGDDCISSSFAEALRLTYGDGVPDVPEMEAAYYRWHPDWDNHASTMRLDWYWEALQSIGVHVQALHEGGDIVDGIARALALGTFPTAWVYLWNAWSRTYFHHAVVVVDYRNEALVVWDQQRNFGWEVSIETFLRGTDSVSSGYAYTPYLEDAPSQPEESMPVDRVAGVVTADTGESLDALINESAERHGVSPVTLLALMIAESNLHTGVKARRERVWPDVSYGLVQQTVWTIHPDAGLPVTRGADRLALDTPENRRIVRDWLEVPANSIPYTARRLAELMARLGETEPLRILSRWNAPAWTLEQNEVNQPESIRNYRNGLAAAETYRVKEATDMAGIVDLRGKLPTIGAYGTRALSGVTGVVIHYTASNPAGTVRSIAEYQTSAAAAPQTGTGEPFPAVAYHYIVKGDGIAHRCHDLAAETWHAGNQNRTTIAVCYIGNAAPTAAQIEGIAACVADAEGQLDRPLIVTGHRDHMATSCPEGWTGWKQSLLDAIGRARNPQPPPADPDELWIELVRIAGQVRATTDTLDYVARPGNTEVTEQVALDESYRIASVWQENALRVHDLVLRLKG